MEQGGNEASKYLVVLLQESSEQVIVGHRDGELAMLRELNVVLMSDMKIRSSLEWCEK